MVVKLHHGKMNMGKSCFLLVARYHILVEMLHGSCLSLHN